MLLGGFMLALGIGIALLSVYMMTRDDSSWKWFVGIPDGLFAAYTGFAVIHYARGGRRPEKDEGALKALATPVTSWFSRRRNKRGEDVVVVRDRFCLSRRRPARRP